MAEQRSLPARKNVLQPPQPEHGSQWRCWLKLPVPEKAVVAEIGKREEKTGLVLSQEVQYPVLQFKWLAVTKPR